MLFSPLVKLANRAIYSANVFFLYFLFFFNGRHSNTCISEANGPIFTKVSGLVEGCKGLFTSLNFFLIFQRIGQWEPIKQVALLWQRDRATACQ